MSKSSKNVTHGETKDGNRTPEFCAFHNAKNRCENPNNKRFHKYGGRGIEFRFESLEEFVKEVGRRPTPKHSLDRIKNNGHYEKGNVRWATNTTQQNNKADTTYLTVDGVTKPLTVWAKEKGLSVQTIHSRLNYGWCASCAVTKLAKRIRNYCVH